MYAIPLIMLSERAEDYLEAILVVHLKKGYVRVKDLSRQLGVSSPTVIEMLRKLDQKCLICYERYGGITLTKEGEEIARAIKDRHDTPVRLLSLAGVPGDVADKDACIIEHRLSPKSLEQLKKLVAALEGEKSHLLEGICVRTG